MKRICKYNQNNLYNCKYYSTKEFSRNDSIFSEYVTKINKVIAEINMALSSRTKEIKQNK